MEENTESKKNILEAGLVCMISNRKSYLRSLQDALLYIVRDFKSSKGVISSRHDQTRSYLMYLIKQKLKVIIV